MSIHLIRDCRGGACDQGRRDCPHPAACEVFVEEDDWRPAPWPVLAWFGLICLISLACWILLILWAIN